MTRAVAIAVAATITLQAADPAAPIALVQKNCIGCHNPTTKNGDIDLKTAVASKSTFTENRELWEKVIEKLRTKQMPPPPLPPPPAEAVAQTAAFLKAEFARQDAAIKPLPGRVSARRLNKAEYNNTIRDLLGVDIRPADAFPADTAAFGFDNISDALNINPALLENYLAAAERSVRTALFGPDRRKPAAIHYSAPVRINLSRGSTGMIKDPFNYDETGLSTWHSFHVMHRFEVDGEYDLRLTLNGHRPNQSMPARPALYVDGKLVKEFEVDATDLEGQIVEVRVPVPAGERLISVTYHRNYHGLPPKYGGPEPSTRPPEPLLTSTRGKLSEKDIETLRKFGTRIKTDGIETRIENRFESIDVIGPYQQKTGASKASLNLVFTCGHVDGKQHAAACPRKIIADFASRAFRRPATAAETGKYFGFYELARKEGDSFEEGIATALQAILIAPEFLFRIEKDPAGSDPAPLRPYELASRLSYFLWSSMPDAELLRVAGNGSVTQPEVLRAQVRRMLRDPKSFALVENFGGQWLQFRNIDVVRPDPGVFPLFDDSLRHAMRRETELFFDSIVRNNGSLLDLLDANYSFLNERLARYYGVPGVSGPEFRRVDMSNTRRGGGILAHGSLLTVTSYSTRTSPVLRGKWILETILNSPPPAPPPGVPPLEEPKPGQNMSLRQQMEAHRSNPACSSCHSRMDPLGFGLENFNAVGAWRDKDGAAPVDAAGSLSDGRSFGTPAELKQILKGDRSAFLKGVTEKMLVYAIGRGTELYDRPTLKSIVAEVEKNDYQFHSLVLSIVDSLPFKMRSGAPPRS
jgi:hypothetical protein